MTVRVPIAGSPGKVAQVNPKATEGAVLGVNLRWPDGRLVRPEEIVSPGGPSEGEASSLELLVPGAIGDIKAAQSTADAAKADATRSLAQLSDIAADGKLTADEKIRARREYQEITGEEAGIVAQANGYGLTTERNAYTGAIDTLQGYLQGLGLIDAGHAWVSITGTTDINRTTWDTRWKDAYAARQSLLNKFAEHARLMLTHAEDVHDGDFELDGQGWVIGADCVVQVGDGANYTGTRGLVKAPGSALSQSYCRPFPVTPGETIAAQCRVRNFALGANGSASLAIWFYDSAGAFLSGGAVAGWAASGTGEWRRVAGVATAPANAAQCKVGCEVPPGHSAGFWCFDEFRKFRPDFVLLPDDLVGDTLGRRIGLRRPGSGHRIGDNRNLPQIMVGNGRAKVATTITYTASAGEPATATISVGAFTVITGSVSVAYSASSVGVSGTGGTSVTYFLYMDDPAYAGGARTLVATTNGNDVYSADGRIYIGSCAVTFPTSGTGGGDGGRIECIAFGQFIAEDVAIEDARPGTLFHCIDYPSGQSRPFRRRLQAVEHSIAPCVRIETDGGAALVCSVTTPFDLPEGGTVFAPDMLGHQVLTDLGIETVVSVTDAGNRCVAHIHLGGISFAAGEDPAHRIYSHNQTQKP